VTQLLQRMRDELVRRNYAATTIRTYLHALDTCRRQHPSRRLDRLGPRELRRYQAYLFEERKLAIGTVGVHVAALRFFFVRVLKRRALKEELPTPKRHRRLPTVLSPEEVRRLIAGAKNLYHRTMLLTLYGAGLRRSELCPSDRPRLSLTTTAETCRCRRFRCLDPRDDVTTASVRLLCENDQGSCLAKQGSEFRTSEITRRHHSDVPHGPASATQQPRGVFEIDAVGEHERHVVPEDGDLADTVRHDARGRTVEQHDL